MSARKICVITGSRAEYGLLSPLMRLIDESPLTRLQVIATNMHLMAEHGYTWRQIEADGFNIDEKVAMPKPSDDSYGVVDSMATEMRDINEALRRLDPDMVVVLGDRYEILVAVTVAMMHRIPIAHIHGGEVSEGAIDDSIRHAITKMSNLHFTSTADYRRRVIQLGEAPERVFHVGAPGVENIKKITPMPLAELEESIGIKLDRDTIMVTYHPVTLGDRSAEDEIHDFLKALDLMPHLRVLFTMPNSDQGGDVIRRAIEAWCAVNADRSKAYASLGLRRYLSAMQHVGAVVGNSSSGILEAPSAHVPTLNIGDRQKGRTRGLSVLDVASDTESIVAGLATVLGDEFRHRAALADNPYEKEGTAQAIFDRIATYPLEGLARKKFQDLGFRI